MQILRWLFKIAEEEPQRIVSNSTSTTQKARNHEEEEERKRKDLVILSRDHKGRTKHVKRVGSSKVSCENLILLRFFHQTLNLKGLGSFEGCRIPLKKTGSAKGGDSAALGGNKVLPIAESLSSSRNYGSNNQLTDLDTKAKKKKKAAVSRMKELLKWAATAKVLKGAGLKEEAAVAADDDDLVGDESPKISFRLEMEDYTSRDDEISRDLHAAGIGNWITTDSEFVVLEL